MGDGIGKAEQAYKIRLIERFKSRSSGVLLGITYLVWMSHCYIKGKFFFRGFNGFLVITSLSVHGPGKSLPIISQRSGGRSNSGRAGGTGVGVARRYGSSPDGGAFVRTTAGAAERGHAGGRAGYVTGWVGSDLTGE